MLQDNSKFKAISRDTTTALKTRVNKLVDAANAELGGVHFQKVTGECGPGYLYGNIKTLRLITHYVPSSRKSLLQPIV